MGGLELLMRYLHPDTRECGPHRRRGGRASDGPPVREKSRARQSGVYTKTEKVDKNVSITNLYENIH